MNEKNAPTPFIMLDGGDSSTPLYRKIYEAIRTAILSGEFAAKTRIPATRRLAHNLGVSRITVVNAYEQLFAEGYLEGRTGSGTYVAAKLPEDLLETAKTVSKKRRIKQNFPLDLSPFGERLVLKADENSGVRSSVKFQPFQNGLTAIDSFPFEIWARIAARFLKNPPRRLLGYGDSQGFLPLRTAVAAHLKSARGVNCTAQQVVITSGAQQALDLAARIFLSEDDAVITENPCYLEARNSFSATGARISTVDVDGEGFDAAKIPESGEKAKLVYITPSHQYPLGATMSLPRRLALLEWARERNARIIEDDYDSEFRYAGRPLASLQGLDKAGRVIYIGTFSKTIFPGLRIGCAVIPPELVDVFTAARTLTDIHPPLFEQAVLAEFIAEGHFARHVRRMRMLYEQRQKILVSECEKQLSGLLEVEKAAAGMHLIGWLPAGVNDKLLSKKAAENGLKLAPVSDYSTTELPRGGFILGYTAFDEAQIKRGVAKIKELLETV